MKILGNAWVTVPWFSFVSRILDISFNRLKKIENLGTLKKLKKLYLCSNKIEKIENLEQLENLESLELGDNRIRVSFLAHSTQ